MEKIKIKALVIIFELPQGVLQPLSASNESLKECLWLCIINGQFIH
jgi:hypothetical protein